MVESIIIAEDVGVRIMKEYFETKASKVIPQFGFWKGLNLFGNKGYQTAKDELEKNILRRGCMYWYMFNIQHYLEYQKKSSRISYVSQEETIQKDERERMCWWTSTIRIAHKIRIKFTNSIIVRPYEIMCNECSEQKESRGTFILAHNVCGTRTR